MGALSIENLIKKFDGGSIVAVNDISFEIEDGQFLVIVGPSGCGKTTTLNSIAGLEASTNGRIRLDGKDITNQRPQERDIAMVFQNYALYPHKTVRENMEFGLKMKGNYSSTDIDDRVESTAEMLSISDLLTQNPGELSGGQRQRVALGRALVREPSLFLLDEPLSNLDAKLRNQMRAELQDLQQDLGITTVYVTHDQTEAMTMADRIAIMNDGKLQQFGEPLECYHNPNNRFVAGFLGEPSMNFFEVTVDGSALEHEGFRYELSAEIREEYDLVDGELTMGVRPENIEVVDQPGPNIIEVPVHVVEPMGDETIVHVDIGGIQCVLTVKGEDVTDEDESIYVHFDEEAIYLFDKSTGESIKTKRPALA